MSSGAIHFDPIRCENIYKRKDGTLIREHSLKWMCDDDTRPALFLPMPMLTNAYRFWMSLADKWENRKIVSHRNGQSKRGIDHFYVQLSRWIDLLTISFLAFGCDFPWIIINYSATCEFIRNNRYATKFRTAFTSWFRIAKGFFPSISFYYFSNEIIFAHFDTSDNNFFSIHSSLDRTLFQFEYYCQLADWLIRIIFIEWIYEGWKLTFKFPFDFI